MAAEIKPQPSLLEVTRTLSNCASAAQFDFGEDTAIVAVQHMLWQTIDLFEAAAALGTKRENIFALGKIYSNSPVVIGALRDRGITVVPSTTPEPGEFDKYFQRDVDHLWEVVARNIANRDIKRILVLDDGGRCITSIPPELLRHYAVAGIEVVQVETGGLLAGLIQARIHLGLCEEGRAKNRGIHRISPEAQRLVCETWLKAMESRGIDLEQVYGFDPAMLEAARSLSWLAANSEPHPSLTYEPNHDTEAAMARLVDCPSSRSHGRALGPTRLAT
jgi:hypothetical protein